MTNPQNGQKDKFQNGNITKLMLRHAKRSLRCDIRKIKQQYTADQLLTMSKQACDVLLNSTIIQKANIVLLYHSLPDEVNTHQLIQSLSHSKTILLPTVVGDELELHLYDEQTLTPDSTYGIMESKGVLFPRERYEEIDIAIIPGMAFTTDGKRLGRGKGYYDRLLPQLKCPLIGLAFPFQIVEDIPCEAHDHRLDNVIFTKL